MPITLEQSSKSTRIITTMLLFVMCLSMFVFITPDTAFCADDASSTSDAVSEAVNTLATNIYVTMRKIITPLSICSFAAAGFYFLFGGRSGTEKARTAMLAGVIGIMLVVFAPLIGKEISGWVNGYGGGSLSDYNNLA